MKRRPGNAFQRRLEAELAELQARENRIPDPVDAPPFVEPDESTVKAARLAIAQGKHLEKSHV